jgi:uncharacterized protein
MILYIHGFNSSGDCSAAQVLKELFGSEVIAPDLSFDPIQNIKVLSDIVESKSPDEKITVIGNSLGGFYAYYLFSLYDVRTILINPCLKPHLYLSEYSNKILQNYINKKEELFEEKYLDDFNFLFNNIINVEKQYSYLHLMISKKDELINHEETTEKICKLYQTRIYDWDATHRFENLKSFRKHLTDVINGDLDTI